MRYWKVEMGNGYCGCDEEFVTKTKDDEELNFEDCLCMYSYSDGAAGIDLEDEEFEEYTYADIAEDSTWEEITEEEYQFLINERQLEER